MKKLNTFLLLLLIFGANLWAQPFSRLGELPLPTGETGFGNLIAGVDFDGDGLPEVYAVNNNWSDDGAELIPKIYKFEYNGQDGWAPVWSATLNIPKQNTWPALTYGDWDKDGKMEVIWGPVNFTDAATNPDPARIIVFESAGGGSDVMGVPDPVNTGNYLPNADWNMNVAPNGNLRPFRWELTDIDNDGAMELVFVTRAGDFLFGVVSVTNIPDNGDGSETWSFEFTGGTGTAYDLAIIGGNAYVYLSNGNVVPVTYAAGTYTVHPAVTGAAGGGSWNSASVVDINKDGTFELVSGSWSTTNQGVYLLQVDGANITSTQIANLSANIGSAAYINGGDAGDIDGDGNIDFVFGSRASVPPAAITRVEYNGAGAITDPNSYTITVIDQEYSPAPSGRWMHAKIADLDNDYFEEVIYGEGIGNFIPLIIIDPTGSLPVELTALSASVIDGKVQLRWSTATETNNHGFEVQRKSKDSEYKTVAFVKGNGTSTEAHSYSFVDKNVEKQTYTYRLKQIDMNGEFAYSDEIEVDMVVPVEFSLSQNYPNPFNPVTTIKFGLAVPSNVTLKVYNLMGEEVASLLNNEQRSEGTHQISFDASDLASGTYVYMINADGKTISKKMTLLK